MTRGVTGISGARIGRGERSERLSFPHAERVSHSEAARLLKPAFGPSKEILGERIDAVGRPGPGVGVGGFCTIGASGSLTERARMGKAPVRLGLGT